MRGTVCLVSHDFTENIIFLQTSSKIENREIPLNVTVPYKKNFFLPNFSKTKIFFFEVMNFAENQGTEVRFLIRGLEQKVDFSIPSGFNRGGSKLENHRCTSLAPSSTCYKVL